MTSVPLIADFLINMGKIRHRSEKTSIIRQGCPLIRVSLDDRFDCIIINNLFHVRHSQYILGLYNKCKTCNDMISLHAGLLMRRQSITRWLVIGQLYSPALVIIFRNSNYSYFKNQLLWNDKYTCFLQNILFCLWTVENRHVWYMFDTWLIHVWYMSAPIIFCWFNKVSQLFNKSY